ncbi:MAG TPA: CHAT domain-containing protein, partial [Thermoanaerobaculia bacterium]|nr:CHAT domain-containing protein [Thermoanaerobaculia bacterium]
YAEAASRLYEILIRPAEPLLGDRPNLIISPDGPLLQLSFEALLTTPSAGSGGGYGGLPYLILDRSVSYVPSASILAELREPRPASAETAKLFLGFGAPDYGAAGRAPGTGPAAPEGSLAQTFRDSGLLNPQPLPASREEVSRIAGLYPPDRVRLYLDGQASEANVKANPFLKEARRIHFAVHGFVNEKEPELSGLLLSLNGDPWENGLLQTYEIFNLELNADLVVLSACDTGLGKNVSGEGLIGVTRALFYAGAASVVVSLWQVADTSTSDLMVRFYRHLNEAGDRAEALRLSKLELIREGRFDHPYYWAPFILIGQPRSPVTPGVLARQ